MAEELRERVGTLEVVLGEFIFVFASLSIPENVVKYLTRHNVYAMVMGDENMELLNYEAIQVKAKKAGKKK